MDGKKIYEQIIRYYTTTELPVEEIYKKGQKVLDEYYPKVTKILLSLKKVVGKCLNMNKSIKRNTNIFSVNLIYMI